MSFPSAVLCSTCFPIMICGYRNSCDYGMSPLCKADGRLVVITCGDNIYKNTEMCKHAVSYNREPKRMAAMQTLVILKCVCA